MLRGAFEGAASRPSRPSRRLSIPKLPATVELGKLYEHLNGRSLSATGSYASVKAARLPGLWGATRHAAPKRRRHGPRGYSADVHLQPLWHTADDSAATTANALARSPAAIPNYDRRVQIILIVEDDTELRGIYRTALRVAGYFVQEAKDGYEALRAVDADPPDLVVLDLALPRLSGHIVRHELAAQSHTRDIPIVVVTGTADAHDGLDVNCLLRKPVAPDDLVITVQKCLAVGG